MGRNRRHCRSWRLVVVASSPWHGPSFSVPAFVGRVRSPAGGDSLSCLGHDSSGARICTVYFAMSKVRFLIVDILGSRAALKRRLGLAGRYRRWCEGRVVPSSASGREHGVPLFPGAIERGEQWCGRRDSNPHEPLSSTDFHTVYGFRRPDAAFWSDASGLRSGLSLHRPPEDPGIRCCPSSLYTFPARTFRPGLARDCHVTGFPEFGQFCIAGFQASTQVSLSPLRLPVPPRPHGWLRIFVYHKAAARTGQFGFKVSAGFSSLLTWVS